MHDAALQSPHTFAAPVKGTGFMIGVPLCLARYGIAAPHHNLRISNAMLQACLTSRIADRPTARQRSLRRRVGRLPLRRAVQIAADALFQFDYRGAKHSALWSGVEHAWLGRETFLHWAFSDSAIDIPWVVARAMDAPDDHELLRTAVRAELMAYWNECLASLPRTANPAWLPLP